MPGPHSHTNPPSVFTQWSSQEELKHSSMSGERENTFAQPTLNVVEVQGEKSASRRPCAHTGLPSAGWNPHLHHHPREARPGTGKVILLQGKPQREEAKGSGPSSVTHADQMTERMAETELSLMAPHAAHPH